MWLAHQSLRTRPAPQSLKTRLALQSRAHWLLKEEARRTRQAHHLLARHCLAVAEVLRRRLAVAEVPRRRRLAVAEAAEEVAGEAAVEAAARQAAGAGAAGPQHSLTAGTACPCQRGKLSERGLYELY